MIPPIKKAHKKAIKIARQNKCIISFDPNVRLALWNDHDKYKKVINEFIDMADILKVSDDEIKFITGEKDIYKSINKLFRGNVKIIIYTKDNSYHHKGYKVKAIDTTGAGDAFMSAFIYKLLKNKVTLNSLSNIDFNKYLSYANATAALVTTKLGAISSMPKVEEVELLLKNNNK